MGCLLFVVGCMLRATCRLLIADCSSHLAVCCLRHVLFVPCCRLLHGVARCVLLVECLLLPVPRCVLRTVCSRSLFPDSSPPLAACYVLLAFCRLLACYLPLVPCCLLLVVGCFPSLALVVCSSFAHCCLLLFELLHTACLPACSLLLAPCWFPPLASGFMLLAPRRLLPEF